MLQSIRDRVSELFRDPKKCERVLSMFHLFSNENRFKILCALHEGDLCVNDITELVGGKHSNISQQLKMLTLAGYLTRERRDKRIIYHLQDDHIRRTIDFLRSEFEEGD